MKTLRLSHQQPDAIAFVSPTNDRLKNSTSRLAAWVLGAVLVCTTGAGAMLAKPLEQMRPAMRPDCVDSHVPLPPGLAARGFYQNVYR